MRWPWSRRVERRESQPFTDAILAAVTAGVSGAGATASATAALEAAAGVASRGFAAATIEGTPAPVEGALTPAVLALIGRDLIRRGESVFAIEVERGALALRPAGSWDVRGPWRESDWRYRLDLFGPSGNITRLMPSAAVIHCRYAVDPSRPWHGISPLGWASLSGKLHAGAVAALENDMKAASAYAVPMPPGENAQDQDDDPLSGLKSAIVKARGKSVFVESTAGSFGGDVRDAPRQDWVQRRLGADPPEALAGLLDATALQVLAACGVDPVLTGLAKGDGTLAREAYRRFERLTLQPLARIVEAELAAKLDAPDLALNFDSLRASDFAGIARSLKAMLEAGVSIDAASAILDIDLEERTA